MHYANGVYDDKTRTERRTISSDVDFTDLRLFNRKCG